MRHLAFALVSVFLLARCSDSSKLLDASSELAPLDEDVTTLDAPIVDTPAPDAALVDAPIATDATADVTIDRADAASAGITFRTWAPAASEATLQGDFGERAMTSDGRGAFTVTVPEARAGMRYRFILRNGDRTLTRVDARARQLRDGDSVVVDPSAYAWRTATFTPPRLREAVIYELHIGSFAIDAGARNGTFASLTARLDGLADLGVNVIELMPVNEFASGTSWGYGPRHWFATNSAYGTPDEFRTLVDEAHARGMAVVLDAVFNHYTGNTSAPLYCYDGDCPTGTFGPYFFRDPMYRSTPWGPRPDFANAEVSGAILDSVSRWLTEYRVDGFRWDSVSNIRGIDGVGTVPGGRELLLRANDLTRALRPSALVIAEDLKGYDAITRPASSGGFGFDTQWDGFVYDVPRIIAGASDDARDMSVIRDAVVARADNDGFRRVIGTENHDTVGNGGLRLPQRVDGADPGSFAARKRSMLAAALALTVPGVPMLFMGQEHLEVGTFAPTPAPIDWSRDEAHARVRAFYRELIRLRRNLGSRTAGLLGSRVEVTHLSATNKVIAYRRWDRGGDDVVVIANLRNRAYARYDIGLPAGGTWRVRVDSDDPRWSTDFRGPAPASLDAAARPYDNQPFTGSVVLGPWSVVVLSRDP